MWICPAAALTTLHPAVPGTLGSCAASWPPWLQWRPWSLYCRDPCWLPTLVQTPRPLPTSFPGLCCAHQWPGCFSWPSGLFSSSSSYGGGAESTGLSGCPLGSLEGLGLSQLPTDAGPHWARTASASSESGEEPGLREGALPYGDIYDQKLQDAIAEVEDRGRGEGSEGCWKPHGPTRPLPGH